MIMGNICRTVNCFKFPASITAPHSSKRIGDLQEDQVLFVVSDDTHDRNWTVCMSHEGLISISKARIVEL